MTRRARESSPASVRLACEAGGSAARDATGKERQWVASPKTANTAGTCLVPAWSASSTRTPTLSAASSTATSLDSSYGRYSRRIAESRLSERVSTCKPHSPEFACRAVGQIGNDVLLGLAIGPFGRPEVNSLSDLRALLGRRLQRRPDHLCAHVAVFQVAVARHAPVATGCCGAGHFDGRDSREPSLARDISAL